MSMSKRWCRSVVVIASGISILLGLVVMVAWHFQVTAVIQVMPGSPPIRYNTALAFLLSGIALFSLKSNRKQGLAIATSGLVLLIGGLTLSEYIFDLNLGIDQLFVEDYLTNTLYGPGQAAAPTEPIQQFWITVTRPLPGRPSPNTALAFTLVGTALVSLSFPKWKPQQRVSRAADNLLLTAIAGILATGIIGIGTVALMGYLTDMGTAHTWRYLTGVSIPTALGLIILGLGIFSTALGTCSENRLPDWFPISMGVGVLTASILLWQALVSWSNQVLHQLSSFADEVKLLLLPVANIVLLGGILLSLLVAGILYFDQQVKAQADSLKRLNRELAQARSLLTATLEATADGVIALGANQQVIHVNQRFINLWPIPKAILDAVQAGDNQAGFHFIMSQMKDPDGFAAATQRMFTQLDQKTFDVLELKDGRMFERYSRPQWLRDQIVGKVLSYRDVTQRYQAEAALQESETRYRSVVAALAEGIILQDADGKIQTSNARAEEILGLNVDQLQGRTSRDPRWQSIHEDGSPFAGDQHPAMLTLQTGKPCRNVVMGVHKPNGDLTWISINSQPLFQPGETLPYAVVTSFADITQRKVAEAALFREKELAQVTLHSIGDAVITTDINGHIEYFNPMAEALTAWSQHDAKGLPLTTVFRIFHEETRQIVSDPVQVALQAEKSVELPQNTVLITRDGRELGIDDSAAPIRDRNGQIVGAVLVFRDVTHQRQLTRQVAWQAIHDPLTGLVNRREFEQQLENALASAMESTQTHALCYIDLDQFKIVNDTCGHVAGDELLRQVTSLLQTRIRKTDILARLGGDEFGLLLHQCPLEQAEPIADLLRENIQTFRFVWEDKTFTIGASIGLVPINAQSGDLASVLIAADAACYAAKNNGRNRIQVFHPNDQALQQHQNEINWVVRLQAALAQNQFCLYAQQIAPIAEPNTATEHYEILLRLHDAAGGLVPPMAFIPAAERYNLMHQIDRWVIRTVFQNWAVLQPPKHPPASVVKPRVYAINLSGSSLNDDGFIAFLQDQLTNYAVPPQLLCFEITETAAIANFTKATQFIQTLRNLGCRFALDDFGIGMSSFAYLKHLPVDYLKIDGSFVKDIVDDPIDDAMVAAISHIGQVMGLKTIAEFVENDAILARLKTHGVDYAQGYGIAKPQPLLSFHDQRTASP